MTQEIRTLSRQIHNRSVILMAALSMAVAVLLFSPWSPAYAADSGRSRIIVSGASGQVGSMVVEELLSRGVPPQDLILVSRTPDELSRYAQLGAATRFGDFTQPESLPAAYEGGERLLLISISAGPDNRPQLHKNAIDAAVQVGVRHIVYTSTVDAENMDEAAQSAAMHRETETILRNSGVAWTILRNQLYADGIVGQAARMLAAGQVVVQPDEIPTAFVTREDCAAAAAGALIMPGHENMIYNITGPTAVLRSDIARIASQITGRPIELIQGAGGEPQAAGAIAGFNSFDVTSNAVELLAGRPATSVEQLLESNREALMEAVRNQ